MLQRCLCRGCSIQGLCVGRKVVKGCCGHSDLTQYANPLGAVTLTYLFTHYSTQQPAHRQPYAAVTTATRLPLHLHSTTIRSRYYSTTFVRRYDALRSAGLPQQQTGSAWSPFSVALGALGFTVTTSRHFAHLAEDVDNIHSFA